MTGPWRKLAPWLIGVALLGLGMWWLLATATGGKSAKVDARLNRNLAGAAMESGSDAVAAIGGQIASEAAADSLSSENAHEIRSAPGADAPVDPAAHAAGLHSLCKRAAYRGRPECLQPPAAR
ncbi:hypothetical protein H0274_01710 [Altererythrobacter sp. CC-YST694]|uniref:hypothetical protein n=1 Tax=Altererythrobacter sp. CC-YST694 TaxID=2755038 RepID=UPI001D02FFB0|nr:hypothetical protein [Altererythrobacter sp. CC-YST694]MCB5423961.1 hypothetical protein [Altererythrobacter sp. CC-YST694]